MRKSCFFSLLWVGAAFAYAFMSSPPKPAYTPSFLVGNGKHSAAPDNLTMFGTALIYGLPGLITLSLTRSAGGRPPDPVAGQRNAAAVLLSFGVILILIGIGAYVLNLSYVARQSTTSEPDRAPELVAVDLDGQSRVSHIGADGGRQGGPREAQYAP